MEKQTIEDVYKEHAQSVYKYLFCLSKDANLAEELTQETFYQAAKGIKKFRGECKISVWLCTIAKRLWYKEISKKTKNTLSLDEVDFELKSSENLENNYVKHMDAVHLFKLLHTLDEKTKEIMYLRLTGSLSFKEIGEIIGESEVYARVTFYRTKQKIIKGALKNEL